MYDYFKYKQNLLIEYNNLFNKYSHQNDSYSVNCRLLYLDTDNSNWDSVGGSLSRWDQKLNQLNWKIYENVPLLQNAPAITQFDSHESTETFQTFTATIKFNIIPKPDDLLMFYDDASNIVYRISDVRFHRNTESVIKNFECDFESAPIDANKIYNTLRVESHEYYNQFNCKLYDFNNWMSTYQPVLNNIDQIVIDTNKYFDPRSEKYNIIEFNQTIKDIKINSKLGAVTRFETPFGKCNPNECSAASDNPETNNLYDKLVKIKEITC